MNSPAPVLLIVGGDPEDVATTASALDRRFGRDYQVLTAGSAGDGLAKLARLADRSEQVALVAADLHLPDLEGVQLLERAAELHRVTSLQTFAEELFFRGYVLQALGLATRRRWLLVAVSAVEFAISHVINVALGGQWVTGSLYYLATGAFFALVTLRDGRLELAIGVHAAINLFIALLVNAGHSGMPTEAVWQTQQNHPLYGLLATCAIAAIFYGLLLRTPWVLVGRNRERRPGDPRDPHLSAAGEAG